ncbi:MAG: 4Fe-4S binding protein [Verrucomicrobiota bacterium]
MNQESGAATIEAAHAMVHRPAVGQVVTLVDGSKPPAAGETIEPLGRFKVVALTDVQLKLEPAAALTPRQLEHWATCAGPVSVHERSPNDWPSHYADDLRAKEKIEAESFLALDPLVSLSTAVAGRTWVWSLAWAGVLLAVCVFVPRGFCGYLCPLGTLIDVFDFLVGKRVKAFRVGGEGWWVHIKYYLLAGTMVAAVFGVLVSGFVAAIPVITRGVLFIAKPFQDAHTRGWHNVPPITAGHVVSIALFAIVLLLGLLRARFWCKYVCPSGAVFSVFNLLRASERKVESSCIKCNKCVEICPFDAIKPDFTTRGTDCTLCQSCGGVCPTHAIKFVGRGNRVSLKVVNDPPTHETPLGRRGFLAAGVGLATALAGGVAAAVGIKARGANLDDPAAFRPVRPPGSVREQEFLQLCIRCGECFRACPNDVLQPLGLQQGLEGLWTPHVAANWSGCETSCNACGQVCPTGAILPLALEKKRRTRIGLAIVNTTTCLPFDKKACQLCWDECTAAGYNAIEFRPVGELSEEDRAGGNDPRLLAPLVREDRCVGCGLCQARCYAINVVDKGLLGESAIVVKAGVGREDR